MNLECISIPLGAGTPGGSAPLSTGLPVVEGGGTGTTGRDGPGREAESGLDCLTPQLGRADFRMRKNQGQSRKSIEQLLDDETGDHSANGTDFVVTDEEMLAEAKEIILFLAQPETDGAKAIRSAATRGGISYSRAARFFYAKHDTVVRAAELAQLKMRARKFRARRIQQLQNELERLRHLDREPA